MSEKTSPMACCSATFGNRTRKFLKIPQSARGICVPYEILAVSMNRSHWAMAYKKRLSACIGSTMSGHISVVQIPSRSACQYLRRYGRSRPNRTSPLQKQYLAEVECWAVEHSWRDPAPDSICSSSTQGVSLGTFDGKTLWFRMEAKSASRFTSHSPLNLGKSALLVSGCCMMVYLTTPIFFKCASTLAVNAAASSSSFVSGCS